MGKPTLQRVWQSTSLKKMCGLHKRGQTKFGYLIIYCFQNSVDNSKVYSKLLEENYGLAVMRTLVILSSKVWILARGNLMHKSEKLKKMQVVEIVPLTLLFFWTKERIFGHYGRILISCKSEKYRRRKKILEETLRELLSTVAEVDEANIDRLYKRAYLIKLKTEFLDQQIKEVIEEFKFSGSLTLNVITQPFWVVLIIEVVPRVFNFLKELFR